MTPRAEREVGREGQLPVYLSYGWVSCYCKAFWRLKYTLRIVQNLIGGGAARAGDAQGTPTQSHISPSILVYEDETFKGVPT